MRSILCKAERCKVIGNSEEVRVWGTVSYDTEKLYEKILYES